MPGLDLIRIVVYLLTRSGNFVRYAKKAQMFICLTVWKALSMTMIAFADQLKALSDSRDELAKARRQETFAEIRQMKEAVKARGDDQTEAMKSQRAEYTQWRAEAKERCQKMIPQGGGRVAEGYYGHRLIPELFDADPAVKERAKQRHAEIGDGIRKHTSAYMSTLRDMKKERIDTLPVQGGGQHNGAEARKRRIIPEVKTIPDEQKRPDKGEEIRKQRAEYTKWKEDMKDRVQQLPAQGGGRHNGGTGDRRKIIPETVSMTEFQDAPQADKGDEIRAQHLEYTKWKEEMKGRVQQLPMQGGGRHNGESDFMRKIIPERHVPKDD